MYFLATLGTVQRWTFNAYGLSSVAAIVVGIWAHRPERRFPWPAFAAGLLRFVLGDIAFDLYALGGGIIPIPSVADLPYMAAIPSWPWPVAGPIAGHRRAAGQHP